MRLFHYHFNRIIFEYWTVGQIILNWIIVNKSYTVYQISYMSIPIYL